MRTRAEILEQINEVSTSTGGELDRDSIVYISALYWVLENVS